MISKRGNEIARWYAHSYARKEVQHDQNFGCLEEYHRSPGYTRKPHQGFPTVCNGCIADILPGKTKHLVSFKGGVASSLSLPPPPPLQAVKPTNKLG